MSPLRTAPASLRTLSGLLLLILLCGSLPASEVSLRVIPFLNGERLPRAFPETLSKGESILLQLRLNQALLSGEPEFVDLPEALSISQPSRFRAEQNSRQRIYQLTALEAGQFSLGKLKVPTDRGTRSLNLPELQVRQEHLGQPLPLVNEKIFFSISSQKTQIFPGEEFLAEATLFLPMGIRNNRNSLRHSLPTILGSKLMSKTTDYGQRSARARQIDGALYDSILFPLKITSLATQGSELGPVQLSVDFDYTSRQGPSFDPQQRTKRYREVELQSAPLPVEILPLPANSPASFQGAVGRYQLSLRDIQPRSPRFGDPFYLELSVTGEGNLDLLPAPLALGQHNWNIEVISAVTSQPKPIQGGFSSFSQLEEQATREYLLLLRPQAGSRAEELPQLGLTFLNPETQTYETSSIEFPPLPQEYFLSASEAPLIANNEANSPANPAAEAQQPKSPLLSPAASVQSSASLLQISPHQVHLLGAGALSLFLLSSLLWRVHWQRHRSLKALLLAPLRQAQKARSKEQSCEALRQLYQILERYRLSSHTKRQQLRQAQQQLEVELYQPRSNSSQSQQSLQQQAQKPTQNTTPLQLAKQALDHPSLTQQPNSPKLAHLSRQLSKQANKPNKPKKASKANKAKQPPPLLSALALLLSLPLLSENAPAQQSPSAASSATENFPAIASNTVTPNTTTPETLADLAWEAYQQENWQLAYQLWSELGERQGFNASLCTHLGNTSYELERPAEASLWFRRALLQNPTQREAASNLKLSQAKLTLPATDKRLFSSERWLHYLTPILEACARVSWWLAASLLLIPLIFKRQNRTPWWIAATSCLLFSLTSLVIAHGQRTHGSTEERFVLTEASPLRSAPLRSAELIQNLPAGQSCRSLSQRGVWLFVEYPNPRQPRYLQRGWLRQESGQALWPPPAS